MHLVPVLSVSSAMGPSQLPVVILWYFLAIGVLWKNKMEEVDRASAWSSVERTTAQSVTHGCEGGHDNKNLMYPFYTNKIN